MGVAEAAGAPFAAMAAMLAAAALLARRKSA
jgi:uncharacterized protein (TIGR03382 family)